MTLGKQVLSMLKQIQVDEENPTNSKYRHGMESKNKNGEESCFCWSQNFVRRLVLLFSLTRNSVANGVTTSLDLKTVLRS